MINEDEEDLTEEDRMAIKSGREYFRQNPAGGLSLEQVAEECGLTMDQQE
jgi:hypothetical protein